MKNSKILWTFGLVSSIFFSQFASAAALTARCGENGIYAGEQPPRVIVADDWKSIIYSMVPGLSYFDTIIPCTGSADSLRCSYFNDSFFPNLSKSEFVFTKEKNELTIMSINHFYTEEEGWTSMVDASTACKLEN